MNVSLTPELEKRIEERVGSGLYSNASEVVRESLRLLFAADDERVRRLDRLSADIQRGIDQLDQGAQISSELARTEINELSGRKRRV